VTPLVWFVVGLASGAGFAGIVLGTRAPRAPGPAAGAGIPFGAARRAGERPARLAGLIPWAEEATGRSCVEVREGMSAPFGPRGQWREYAISLRLFTAHGAGVWEGLRGDVGA